MFIALAKEYIFHLLRIVKVAKFDLRKSVNENASEYFEKAKKLKNKIQGINSTIEKYSKEKIKFEKEVEKEKKEYKEKESLLTRKKDWYEKFRWFFTSQNKLCIGGRDSSTNEQIIKKYTDENDLVFHTDMAGSPFFILKNGKGSDDLELYEVASITACYSRAWKMGLTKTDVFYVNPEQVSKQAKAGESLSKGSFVIKGKTNYIDHEMRIAISLDDKKRVVIGSVRAFQNKTHVVVIQGSDKTSDVAKKLNKFFKEGLLDEFVKVIPSGGAKISKLNKVKGD